MKIFTFPNGPIKMAGNLHLPKDFSPDRSYVAIVVVHPAGGVKELLRCCWLGAWFFPPISV